MEMHLVEESPCGNSIVGDEPTDEVKSPSSDATGIFGEPQVIPRVGDLYQVEIPQLEAENEKNTDAISSERVNSAHFSLLGLPIPVMWVVDKIDHVKKEVCEDPNDGLKINGSEESQSIKRNQIKLNVSFAPREIGSSSVVDFFSPEHENSDLEQRHRCTDCHPVPGFMGNSWTDIEHKAFLLGLYIFGKNLVQVKRFVESKEMGDILSFYYGKFYKSDGYRRWSDCRRIRSRKCIHGQRIFTGWRQQELLSRLLPHESNVCQDTLIEVSRTFAEGKISLEEYVTTLKTKVGLKNLIEAVGIGKGKEDLTGIVTEPAKVNQVISTRVEIPVGKACSSLTSEDIIKFLKGDFRLSKARSNDLFWEAVWPRLLARGWHSEQPKNHCHASSKHALVFLIPGVKKFSRRRLVKGNHYFDSVTDVLNRVTSDPKLLEIDGEHAKINEGDEKLDQDSHCGQQHCYLRPKILNSNSNLMKFTIVDTSMVHGEELLGIRKLRSLPIDPEDTKTPASSNGKDDQDNSEELVGELDSSDTTSNNQGDNNTSSPSKAFSDTQEINIATQETNINGPEAAKVEIRNHKVEFTGPTEKKLPKTIKCQFSRRAKSSVPSNYLSPITKRRRLTACGHSEASCSIDSFSGNSGLTKKGEQNFSSAEAGPSHEKLFTSSSTKGNLEGGIEGSLEDNCIVASVFPEKCQAQTSFDLNLPHVPLDFETDKPFILQEADGLDEQSENNPSFSSESKQKQEDSLDMNELDLEQQSRMGTRRQSTRSRPLTAKALEALACGFLTTTKRKRKGTEPISEENTTMRPSRRARGPAGNATNSDGIATGALESIVEEKLSDASSNTNAVSKSNDQTERP